MNSIDRVSGAVLVLGIALSGCAPAPANVTDFSSQPIAVTTANNNNAALDGASCTLQNGLGTWYVTTPGYVPVRRAFGDLSINCQKDNLTGSAVVKSAASGGSGYFYPGNVNVALAAGGAVINLKPSPNSPAYMSEGFRPVTQNQNMPSAVKMDVSPYENAQHPVRVPVNISPYDDTGHGGTGH